jgi:hypothetical protein
MNNLGLPLPQKIMEALQCNVSASNDTAMKFPTIAELNEIRQLEPKKVSNPWNACINNKKY